MRLVRIEREKLSVLEENSVTLETVLNILSEHTDVTIYICKEKFLTGIITYRDCERFLKKERKDLINCNFTAMMVENIEGLISAFEKKNLHAIPIIDDDGKLLYEMRRIYSNEFHHHPLLRKWTKNFFDLLIKCGINRIVFIQNSEWEQSVRNMIDEWNYSISVNYESECRTMVDKHTLYIDDNLVRIAYNKWKDRKFQVLQYSQLFYFMNLRHVTVDDYWPFCRQLHKYFKDIIILDENKVTSGIARTFLEHDIECHVISDMDIEYDVENNRYAITSECSGSLVITANFSMLENGFWDRSGKHVTHVSALSWGLLDLFYDKKEHEDIANNVLSQLKKKGVKILICSYQKVCETNAIDADELVHYGMSGEKISGTNLKTGVSNVKYHFDQGYLQMNDLESEVWNVSGGLRRVIGNEEKCSRNIYCVGCCPMLGYMVSDEETIPSLLQKYVSDRYNVYNYSLYSLQLPWNIRRPDYQAGDILIFMYNKPGVDEIYKQSGYQIHDLTYLVEQMDDSERWYWDNNWHCNKKMNELLANRIYELCCEQNLL